MKNAALPFGGLYMLKDKDVEDINRIAGVRMASGMLRGSADGEFWNL